MLAVVTAFVVVVEAVLVVGMSLTTAHDASSLSDFFVFVFVLDFLAFALELVAVVSLPFTPRLLVAVLVVLVLRG